MKLLILSILFAWAMSLQCGNNPIYQCIECTSVDICGKCENGLIGTTCDTCEANEYFVFAQSIPRNRGCINCKYSPCSQCKSSEECVSCMNGVSSSEVPTCG